MNLKELQEAVIRTIEAVNEDGRNTEDIEVSIQVEKGTELTLCSSDIDLHYDNDGCVSGCVIVGETHNE